MGFAPTWLRQVSPPVLHKTTLTTGRSEVSLRGPFSFSVVERVDNRSAFLQTFFFNLTLTR